MAEDGVGNGSLVINMRNGKVVLLLTLPYLTLPVINMRNGASQWDRVQG